MQGGPPEVERLDGPPAGLRWEGNLHGTLGNYVRPVGGVVIVVVVVAFALEGIVANDWLTSAWGLVNLAALLALIAPGILFGFVWAVPHFPVEFAYSDRRLYLVRGPSFQRKVLAVPWERVVSATRVVWELGDYVSLGIEMVGDPYPIVPRSPGEYFARQTQQLDIKPDDFRRLESYLPPGAARATVVREGGHWFYHFSAA